MVLHNYGKAHPGMALPATQQLATMLLGGRLPDHASLEYLKQLAATYLGPGLKASRKAKAAAEEDIIAAKVRLRCCWAHACLSLAPFGRCRKRIVHHLQPAVC